MNGNEGVGLMGLGSMTRWWESLYIFTVIFCISVASLRCIEISRGLDWHERHIELRFEQHS